MGVTGNVCLNMLTYGFSVIKFVDVFVWPFGTAQGQLNCQSTMNCFLNQQCGVNV